MDPTSHERTPHTGYVLPSTSACLLPALPKIEVIIITFHFINGTSYEKYEVGKFSSASNGSQLKFQKV
jgi:hypothetical protein